MKLDNPNDKEYASASGVASSDLLDVLRAVQGELDIYLGDTDPDLMIWDDDLQECREMTDEEIRRDEPLAWCHMQLVNLICSSNDKDRRPADE